MKRIIVLAFLCLLASAVSAEVSFSSLDLNAKNQLLFQATAETPVYGTYRSQFLADTAKKTLEALSCFPERILYLPKTGQLQIQNRFGVFRTTAAGDALQVISPEAFVKKDTIPEGKLLPTLASFDGRYLVYQKESSPVEGSLLLYEIATGETTTVAESLTLNLNQVPVLWSPDSQFFVYEKDAKIYYYSLRQKAEKRVPAELLRALGDGLLGSVSWGASGELYYLWDNILYRIFPEEFFTRSLYAGLFRVGGILGKLPVNFQPWKDQFWLSPNKDQLLLNLGGRMLFLYQLNYLDFYQGESLVPLSYVPLPENLMIKRVLWDNEGRITLLSSSLTSGKEYSQVLRIKGNETRVLITPQEELVRDILLSPSGKTCLLVQDKGLTLYDYGAFQPQTSLANPGTLSAIWKDDVTLIVAGRYSTFEYNLQTQSRKLMLLGEVDQMGFVEGGLIGARRENSFYIYKGKGIWQDTIALTFAAPSAVNAGYRVYTETLPPGTYKNLVMIRDLGGLANEPLFPSPAKKFEPFPSADQPLDADIFSHGSRLRSRQLSFAIDCEDTSEGLTQLLRGLREYGFKATFFINGEFLRRNAGAAKEIAASAQETGSLFYILYNMADSRFVLDSDFIKKGLARQEDDYFAVTGKELGLLWHTPGYFSSKIVLEASKSMNYQFVSADITYPMGLERRVDSADLILDLLKNKKPGSIIPLTLGLKDSKTGESFYSRIDLLFNGLINLGYKAVTVSTLKDQARQ